MKSKIKLIISILIGTIVLSIIGYKLASIAVNIENQIGGIPIQKTIIKAYSPISVPYTPITKYPIDDGILKSKVYNRNKDRFCIEHGTWCGGGARHCVP